MLAEIQGECSLAERETLLDDLASDPAYRQGFNILYDQRECTSALSAAENRTLIRYAGRHKQTFDGSKLAVVVGEDAMSGLGRMQDMLGGPKIKVTHFRDYQEALHWVTDRP